MSYGPLHQGTGFDHDLATVGHPHPTPGVGSTMQELPAHIVLRNRPFHRRSGGWLRSSRRSLRGCRCDGGVPVLEASVEDIGADTLREWLPGLDALFFGLGLCRVRRRLGIVAQIATTPWKTCS